MRIWLAGLIVGVGTSTGFSAEPVSKETLQRIQSLGKEGVGNKEAALAWQQIVAAGPEAIIPVLNVYDSSSVIARNWLRTAIDAILEKPLPTEEWIKNFETYLMDNQHGPAARKLAYDGLKRLDPKSPERVLPKLLNDRNVDIRRDALSAELEKVEKKKPTGDEAKKLYAELFALSRDEDQVESIGKKLKDLGVEVNYQKHLGILAEWQLLGPFDGKEGKAYAEVLEPEKKLDLTAKPMGKEGKPIEWKVFNTKDNFGVVDLNKAIGKFKHAVAFAYVNVEVEKDQIADLRFGSITALRVFLNGKEIFANEEYHHGQKFDQYVVKVPLKAGKNDLLVKVVQNDMKEPWAQDWQYQMRLCDDTGGAIAFKTSTQK
ncbi:hypothetical protein KIH39_15070 [Telmatocola sphagniphila]|uniref:HEAT repeat domain-containing protein n=1 Tax=Telmatocola sphagniphila TaxID=1123043 RepID=A0A8E6ETJ3_9BACT|nr:hypothetical protein [Telmatocola sphagniphila]QVL30175.1 hypothetical protein KIH39_15070 [Telmatocola sphagniphila]